MNNIYQERGFREHDGYKDLYVRRYDSYNEYIQSQGAKLDRLKKTAPDHYYLNGDYDRDIIPILKDRISKKR